MSELQAAIDQVDDIKRDAEERGAGDFAETVKAGGDALNGLMYAYGVEEGEMYDTAIERFHGALSGIAGAIRKLNLDMETAHGLVQQLGPSLWADGVLVGILLAERKSIPEKEA